LKRFLTAELAHWKEQARRKPLVLRGARQVGKTWTVLDFGRTHFEGRVHHVDLEKRTDWHRIFDGDLAASRVLSELELLLNRRIVPGRDLLFLDEIQSAPRALMALRYFYEECPDLHVIAAGSLLEFAMGRISFPVGRVQFLTMQPMSFAEFLLATGKDLAAEVVLGRPCRQAATVHDMLLGELRSYMFVGGMPECVLTFARTGKLAEAFEVQAELAHSYRHDFSKYAPHSDRRCLDAVFVSVARNVGRQVKYARLAEGFANSTIKKAFDLLCLAQVVRRVPSAAPSGLPLAASASQKRFKALLVDIGLMQHLCGMHVPSEYAKKDLLDVYEGAMAEQFVGQELSAGGQEALYYWAREAKSSTAEVDFLAVTGGRILPIEVKSGPSGRLRSLHLLLRTFPNCPKGFVLSTGPYDELPDERLVFVPLYYAGSLVRDGASQGNGLSQKHGVGCR
jgi:hypothetical protein